MHDVHWRWEQGKWPFRRWKLRHPLLNSVLWHLHMQSHGKWQQKVAQWQTLKTSFRWNCHTTAAVYADTLNFSWREKSCTTSSIQRQQKKLSPLLSVTSSDLTQVTLTCTNISKNSTDLTWQVWSCDCQNWILPPHLLLLTTSGI